MTRASASCPLASHASNAAALDNDRTVSSTVPDSAPFGTRGSSILLVGIRGGGRSCQMLSSTIIYDSSDLEIVIMASTQHYEQMVATRELPVYLRLHSIILQLPK
ncbi:Argininosuccinate lyase [Fusarium oxysporum f. sp. albedinis]|nr:Argininosuccinate lyase [Fusarium oxysporum f. sp. albedinis]